MKKPSPEVGRGPVYLDASALVKLFVPAAESDDLNEALIGAEDVVSDLALTETASALGRRTREGLLARRNPLGCTGKQRSPGIVPASGADAAPFIAAPSGSS